MVSLLFVFHGYTHKSHILSKSQGNWYNFSVLSIQGSIYAIGSECKPINFQLRPSKVFKPSDMCPIPGFDLFLWLYCLRSEILVFCASIYFCEADEGTGALQCLAYSGPGCAEERFTTEGLHTLNTCSTRILTYIDINKHKYTYKHKHKYT